MINEKLFKELENEHVTFKELNVYEKGKTNAKKHFKSSFMIRDAYKIDITGRFFEEECWVHVEAGTIVKDKIAWNDVCRLVNGIKNKLKKENSIRLKHVMGSYPIEIKAYELETFDGDIQTHFEKIRDNVIKNVHYVIHNMDEVFSEMAFICDVVEIPKLYVLGDIGKMIGELVKGENLGDYKTDDEFWYEITFRLDQERDLAIKTAAMWKIATILSVDFELAVYTDQ